ncbi:MAG TPA: MFS transporter [Chitinophagaceae bacterium]|nr:MFS transporter [Chitinophagaceae bacterium]
MSKKERIIIILLAAINFTHILDFMIMMPLGNYLMPHFRISPQQFSILLASYPISSFASGIMMALFADKFERKSLLLITYAGFIIGTAACGFAQSYELLLVSRIVAGIFGGIIGGQVLSMIGDLFTFDRRGTAMGAVMSAFAVASSIGVTFSLYLVDIFKDNWHVPFLFVAILAIVIWPICFYQLPVLRSHLTEQHTSPGKLKQLIATLTAKSTGLALLFSGLMMMGHFLIIPFINPYMEFNKGYPRSVTPLIYLVGGVSSFIAAVFLGRLSDRIGKLAVFSYCVPLSFIMVILITNLPALPFSIVLSFFAIWFALATGRAVSSQTMVSNVTGSANRGSFMSLNSSIQHLGTGAAALVAGYIVTEGKSGKLQRYEWVGYLSVVVLLAGFFLGRYLFKGTELKKSPPSGL